MVKQRLVPGLAAGLALAVCVAEAQDVVTNEIVVTATREAKETWQVPANVSVITTEDIRDSQAANVVDLLKNLGGINIRSISAGPATAEIAMRGFGDNSHGRVLVLLDGRKLNRPDMAGVNWLEVPISNVERIEVVRGGNTALYGDHAVAGVVNIITKKGDKDAQFNISGEAGSFGTTIGRIGATGSAGPVTFSANGERYESDGFRDRTGFLSQGGGVNLNCDLSDNVAASIALSWQNVEYEIPGWLSKQQMDDDPEQAFNQDDSAENEYLNASIGLNATISDDQRADINIAFGRQDITSDMASWFSYADVLIDTIGASPSYTLKKNLLGRENSIRVGVDYYSDDLSVDRFADATRGDLTTSAEVTKDTLGAYVRDEFSVIDSLVLAAGARAESAEISADVASMGAVTVDDSRSWDQSAFDLSLIRTFENKSKLFVRGGTVYRYPFVDELVSYIGFGGDSFNSTLDPETGWNAELGGEAVLADGVRAALTVFNLSMEDEISWNSMTYMNENLDETTHRGMEASFSYSALEAIEISGNYTFTHAEFAAGQNDGKDVPLVPAHKATVDVKLALPLDLSLDTIVTYTGESYLGSDYANTHEKLSDYTVVDIFLRHKSEALPGFEAYIGAENVFDEQYASLAYWSEFDQQTGYYPSAGTSFRGGLAYRF